jgi:outer membrane protein assembly factor BamB
MNFKSLVGCTFTILVTACLVSVAHSQTTPTSHWAQFRGTDGTGIAESTAQPPTQWETDKQTAWEVEIPGTGWSSPVYEGDKVWVTSAVTEKATEAQIAEKLKGDKMAKIKTLAASVELHAICVDINSGKVVHDIKLAKVDDPNPINPMNSYASPTPAISNGKVVCHFGNYGTWCLDEKSGDVLWTKQFVIKHSVGPGSSPVIFGDKLIIVCDGTDLQYVVGLELETGEQVWKTDRPPMRAGDGEHRKAYCTPLLIEVAGKKQAVIPGAQWVVGYDPDSGAELWRADHGDGFSVATMPVYESGLVVFSTGYLKGDLVAVDPRGTGDVTETGIVWSARSGPKMPSLIGSGGQIYTISEKGILMCLDAKTGTVVNRQRVGGNFSSSPILAGGNLYLSSREGKMTVVKCSSELETVATNKFDGSLMASPVLVGDDLLIRTEKKLIRIKGGATL